MKLERSVYEILQIIGISLTDKTHLWISSANQISIMSMNDSVLVNQVCLIHNRPHFLVDSSAQI